MKEAIENIIMILDDVRYTYANDNYINERLSTAIQRLKELKKKRKNKKQ